MERRNSKKKDSKNKKAKNKKIIKKTKNNKLKSKTNEKPVRTKNPFITGYLLWRLSTEKMYGYQIKMESSEYFTSNMLPVSIYSLLSGLEKRGLISSIKKEVNGRIRKIYFTTKKGKRIIKEMKMEKIKGRIKEFVRFIASCGDKK